MVWCCDTRDWALSDYSLYHCWNGLVLWYQGLSTLWLFAVPLLEWFGAVIPGIEHSLTIRCTNAGMVWCCDTRDWALSDYSLYHCWNGLVLWYQGLSTLWLFAVPLLEWFGAVIPGIEHSLTIRCTNAGMVWCCDTRDWALSDYWLYHCWNGLVLWYQGLYIPVVHWAVQQTQYIHQIVIWQLSLGVKLREFWKVYTVNF